MAGSREAVQMQESYGAHSLPEVTKREVLHDAHDGDVKAAKCESYPLADRISPAEGFDRGFIEHDLVWPDEPAGMKRLVPEKPAPGKTKSVGSREMFIGPQIRNAQYLVGRRPFGNEVQHVPVMAVGYLPG